MAPFGASRAGLMSVAEDDIPDSAIYQWDATELSLSDGDSVSSWTDEIGELELTGAATYRDDGINGVAAVEFDGTDDTLDSAIDSETQPYEIILVAFTNETSSTDGAGFLGWDSNDGFVVGGRGSGGIDALRSDGDDELQGDATDTDAHIWSAQFDGSESTIRRDGSDANTGSAGTGPIENSFALGSIDDGTNYLNGRIGEVLIYDSVLSASERGDEEDRLAEKWGITI